MMCEPMVYFLLGSCLLLQTIVLGAVVWAALQYIRARRRLANIGRRMDNLIDDLLEAEAPRAQDAPNAPDAQTLAIRQQRRERLAAVVSGGQAREYLGRVVSVDQVDAMTDDEIEKHYTRYEARLGATMVKTLGRAALELYAAAASAFLPIPAESRQLLLEDLQTDPFVGQALNTAACDLYHRYGQWLAPLTAGLTTAKYCRFKFKHQCPKRDTSDDGEPTDREPADREPGRGASSESD